ncbi:MAG: hypothetical protein CL687_05145 [Candidatus Pelagibacter sp.]|nr:hypothetical protein [Candidatus Pelagibacter sp.]OUV96082.1 MAG: hypothetical protein CBD02_05405 [Candidatus Pelagibacter sp. TMED142]OUV98653.1 MAG: hypothetical protein CBD02_00715 [Candidatus Pelagibacter sp. TMED142]|tara:strand:- start:1788 stop:2399 length:612 start_codon:yes stop_codon:yes gene_type:complete
MSKSIISLSTGSPNRKLGFQGLKSIAVIGSRSLPFLKANHVGDIVDDLLKRKYHIATGGAIGADQFVIERLLRSGRSDRCTVYSPWQNYAGFPVKVRAMMRQFKSYGGNLLWGEVSGNAPHHIVKMGLLLRNQIMVDACYGLVAFIDGHARGSIFSIKRAAKKRLTIVIFPHDCHLPEIDYVKWVPLKCGGVWEDGFKAVYLK